MSATHADTQLEQPASRATFEELVDEHAERIYGLVVLLLGDRAIAEAVVLDAYRSLWDALDRGLILGDQEETLFRAAVQRAVRRLNRSSELRGTLPPTTADDRQITAYGIVQQLIPEHRAAVLAVIWAGLDYRLAGLASGVGRDRARDVVFSARQEYREAYGGGVADAPACRAIAPALSMLADGELEGEERTRAEEHLASCGSCPATAAAFDAFNQMIRALRVPAEPAALRARLLAIPEQTTRPTGIRRLIGLAAGPALLVIVLAVGLFALQQCAEPTIKTGVGRTSDVIYASRGNAVAIIDAGSGRELGRLPLAVVGRSGTEAYGTGPPCGPGGSGTTIRAVDAATLQIRDIGCVDGMVKVLAANDQGGRVFLGDALGSSEQLLVFDVRQSRVIDTITADATLTGVFANRVAMAPDGSSLFSTTAIAEPGRARFAVAETDLNELRIVGVAEIPEPCGPDAVLLPIGPDEVYAYQVACGRLHELHPRSGRPARTLDLGENTAPTATQALLAAPPTGDLLYVLMPGNGILIVDRSRFLEVRRLTPERPLTGIAASTDGGALYATAQDGSYLVLDAGSGRTMLRRGNVGQVEILQVNAGE